MLPRRDSATGAAEVPEAFRVWLEEHLASEDDPGDVEAVLRATRSAVGAALSPEGRERGGAFDLLAADGHLTAAVGWVIDRSAEPLAELERMVDELQDGVDAS